jgi:hypothetical protein
MRQTNRSASCVFELDPMAELPLGTLRTERNAGSTPVRPPRPKFDSRPPLVGLQATLGAPHYKNAAKYCKAVREAKGVDAFQTQYGTNNNKEEHLWRVRLRDREGEGREARGRRGAECRDRCV